MRFRGFWRSKQFSDVFSHLFSLIIFSALENTYHFVNRSNSRVDELFVPYYDSMDKSNCLLNDEKNRSPNGTFRRCGFLLDLPQHYWSCRLWLGDSEFVRHGTGAEH